jgi:hypothetical protein
MGGLTRARTLLPSTRVTGGLMMLVALFDPIVEFYLGAQVAGYRRLTDMRRAVLDHGDLRVPGGLPGVEPLFSAGGVPRGVVRR